MNATSSFSVAGRARGFTLVELMIAVIILAVLAAVALPTFQGYSRKGKRSEAFTSLAALQQAQERWRSNNSAYTETLANTAAAGAPPNGLGVPASSSNGLYTVSVSASSETGYTALATAVAGTSQAGDSDCKVLGVQFTNGTLRYGSAAGDINWGAANADAGKCWAR